MKFLKLKAKKVKIQQLLQWMSEWMNFMLRGRAMEGPQVSG